MGLGDVSLPTPETLLTATNMFVIRGVRREGERCSLFIQGCSLLLIFAICILPIPVSPRCIA